MLQGSAALPMGIEWVVHQAHDFLHPDLAIGHSIAVVLIVAEHTILQRAPPPAELCTAQESTEQPP